MLWFQKGLRDRRAERREALAYEYDETDKRLRVGGSTLFVGAPAGAYRLVAGRAAAPTRSGPHPVHEHAAAGCRTPPSRGLRFLVLAPSVRGARIEGRAGLDGGEEVAVVARDDDPQAARSGSVIERCPRSELRSVIERAARRRAALVEAEEGGAVRSPGLSDRRGARQATGTGGRESLADLNLADRSRVSGRDSDSSHPVAPLAGSSRFAAARGRRALAGDEGPTSSRERRLARPLGRRRRGLSAEAHVD